MIMTNESVVEAWTDVLNRHDADAAAAWISDDLVFTNTGNGQRFIGAAVEPEALHGAFRDVARGSFRDRQTLQLR